VARIGFVALVADDHGGAATAADDVAARLQAETGWSPLAAVRSCRVWSTRLVEIPLHRLPDGRGLVLGDLFEHPDARGASRLVPGTGAAKPNAFATAMQLSRQRWGRYVALISAVDGWSAFRDPGGQLDALVWRRDPGLTVVASDIADLPAWLRPPRLALNWERIAAFLAAPAATTTEPLFDGVSAVGPGDLLPFRPGAVPQPVWRPAQFLTPLETAESAAAALVPRVDAAVADMVGPHRRMLFELSGGLDSAILAGALGALGQTCRVSQWLHWADSRGEADEQRFARAVADRLGVPLTVVPQPVAPIEPSDLAELASSFWPAMSGADTVRDRDETARLRASGADAIVSGQGGDAVFFQMRSAQVMADALRLYGPRVLTSPLLPAVARRSQQSIWSVLAEVRRGGPARPASRSSLISPWLRAAAPEHAHAWVLDPEAQAAPPGKRLQIRTLANCHVFHGQSRRRAVADLLYPLLAQPVVELCLRIPTPVLAGDPHDRRYARRVFAERLPDAVRERTTKGALNGYFSHLVMASRTTLGPFLREGCLVEAGLLDPVALERVFDPNFLIQGGFPTEVLWAASVEAWVRYWQTQLPDSAAAPRWRPN
jgi:asparagine synthase (glutamine-hydrolysing)